MAFIGKHEHLFRKDLSMEPITLQQIITLALPVVAMIVSYALQQAHFSDRTNTTIASVTVFLAAAATAFINGNLSGNLYLDIVAITTASIALQNSSFQPLQKYLQTHVLAKSNQRTVPPTVQDWRKDLESTQ
jgi:hypothetical protein